MLRERSAAPLLFRSRAGRRSGTLAKARADPREAKWIFHARPQIGATQSKHHCAIHAASRPRRFSGCVLYAIALAERKGCDRETDPQQILPPTTFTCALRCSLTTASGPIQAQGETAPGRARARMKLSPATHASCSPGACSPGCMAEVYWYRNRPYLAPVLNLANAAAQTALAPSAGRGRSLTLPWPTTITMASTTTSAPAAELAIARRKLPNNCRGIRIHRHTSIAGRAIGKKPRATWSAPLSRVVKAPSGSRRITPATP